MSYGGGSPNADGALRTDEIAVVAAGEAENRAMTPREPGRQKRSFRLVAGVPGLGIEASVLLQEAERLRDEFTPEKRDELLQAIEQHEQSSPEARRAAAELTYFLTMYQTNATERGTRQLAWATWILALATLGLLIATIVLV